MIQVDISKALHPRIVGYLPPLMPGLFFELSILATNPQVVHKMFAESGLGYYTELIAALIGAFLIGNGFVLFVRLIQIFLGRIYRISNSSWIALVRTLVPRIGRLLARPALPFRFWLNKFFQKQQALGYGFSPALMETQRAWHVVTSEVLKQQYGIDVDELPRQMDWGVWYSVLGVPEPEDMRGSRIVIASHATGWAGLAALRFSPMLRSRYYVGFCIVLMVYGLLHDWEVARRLNNPVTVGLLKLRSLLRELKLLRTASNISSGKSPEDSTAKAVLPADEAID
jgi:hypothetical protein